MFPLQVDALLPLGLMPAVVPEFKVTFSTPICLFDFRSTPTNSTTFPSITLHHSDVLFFVQYISALLSSISYFVVSYRVRSLPCNFFERRAINYPAPFMIYRFGNRLRNVYLIFFQFVLSRVSLLEVHFKVLLLNQRPSSMVSFMMQLLVLRLYLQMVLCCGAVLSQIQNCFILYQVSVIVLLSFPT